MLAPLLRGVLASLLIALAGRAAHASGQGIIRGAEMVNVRRGPSLDTPAFIALRKGTLVTVERVIDGWAFVHLASGQGGYVKAALVELPAGIAVETSENPTAAIPSSTPEVLPTETPAVAGENPPETQDVISPHDTLQAEVAQLRERLAALESAVVITPGAPNRLEPGPSDAVAQIDDGQAAHPSGLSAAAPLRPEDIGPSLALAGVGLIVGFLLGAAYGRRQERGRRSRVRF